MDYPMINNTLVFRYNETDDTYDVRDFLDSDEKSYTIAAPVFHFLQQLDGYTYPYDIDKRIPRDVVNRLLAECRKKGLLRKKMYAKSGFGTFTYTIFIPKNRTNDIRPGRILCYFLNWIIMLSFLPVLALGIYFSYTNGFSSRFVTVGFFAGLIAGVFLHEISHAVSGIAYGARFFEMGVMLSFFILPGAYVLFDDTPVKKPLRRTQIFAAGIEMNLLLSGLFFILSSVSYGSSGFFFGCAVSNISLALINAIVTLFLDGEKVISTLIGDKDFVFKGIATVFGKKERRILKEQGINGYVVITASVIITVSQFSLLVIIVSNVIGVILCFV